MKCFKCEKKIDFWQQVKEWSEMFGDEAMLGPEFPIMIMLDCPHCDEQIGMVNIIGINAFEDVEGPMGIVKMPKLKQKTCLQL